MNKTVTKNRNLLERFSSSLIGRGKKNCGYKTLLDSLFILRQNHKKTLHNSALPEIQLSNTIIKNSLPRNKHVEKVVKNKTERGAKQEKTNVLDQSNLLRKTKNPETISLPGKTVLHSFLNKSICRTCVDNVRPILETRKVRKGRITYQVPLVTQGVRQEGKAITFLIENATFRQKSVTSTLRKDYDTKRFLKKEGTITGGTIENKKHTFLDLHYQNVSLNESLRIDLSKQLNSYSLKNCLSEEFYDSFSGKGGSVDKKKQLHQLALQNRAYTHYRWW